MAGIDDLIAGNFFTAVLSPFTNAGVPLEIIYLIIISSAMGFIYIKSKKFEYVSLTLFVTSTALMPVISPVYQKYFFVLMVIGLVTLIYNLFKTKGYG